jgi:hypothetical protein
MRLPRLLLCLFLCSPLLAANNGAQPAAAPDKAPAAPTTPDANSASAADTTESDLYWQSQDWLDAGQAKQIGDQVTLRHKSDQGYRLGLALLLPDWQQVADLLPLSRSLNQQGFDTLIMLPSPHQLDLDPNDEKDQPAIEAFRELWQRRLTSLQENSGDSSGYQLIIAAGSSAAWLGNLLSTQAITAPDALVLVDAYYPAPDANEILAHDIASAPFPVLDLYRDHQVSWLDLAANARRLDVERNSKLDWRQVAVSDNSERETQLAGWLRHLGWK